MRAAFPLPATALALGSPPAGAATGAPGAGAPGFAFAAIGGPGSRPLLARLRAALGEAAGPRWSRRECLIGPGGRAAEAPPTPGGGGAG